MAQAISSRQQQGGGASAAPVACIDLHAPPRTAGASSARTRWACPEAQGTSPSRSWAADRVNVQIRHLTGVTDAAGAPWGGPRCALGKPHMRGRRPGWARPLLLGPAQAHTCGCLPPTAAFQVACSLLVTGCCACLMARRGCSPAPRPPCPGRLQSSAASTSRHQRCSRPAVCCAIVCSCQHIPARAQVLTRTPASTCSVPLLLEARGPAPAAPAAAAAATTTAPATTAHAVLQLPSGHGYCCCHCCCHCCCRCDPGGPAAGTRARRRPRYQSPLPPPRVRRCPPCSSYCALLTAACR